MPKIKKTMTEHLLQLRLNKPLFPKTFKPQGTMVLSV